MEKTNKKNTLLKIFTIISWCLFFGLCWLVSGLNFNSLLLSIFLIVDLVIAIILSIKLRKKGNKKILNKKFVDGNILEGRRLYKNAIKYCLKHYIIIGVIVFLIVLLSVLIYYIVNFDLIMIIVFSVSMVVVPVIYVLMIYLIYKKFYFRYKEVLFNDETFVLYTAKDRGDVHYTPELHVVYGCKEYTEFGRTVWSGTGNLLDDVLFASLSSLIDWFNDEKFTNYLRIDVKTEKSGKVQCLYKLGTGEFIVTDKLDKLKGCFEISKSNLKKKSKNK